MILKEEKAKRTFCCPQLPNVRVQRRKTGFSYGCTRIRCEAMDLRHKKKYFN